MTVNRSHTRFYLSGTRPDGTVFYTFSGGPSESEWEAEQLRRSCRLLEDEANRARKLGATKNDR